jgi:serine/threonine protein kinase
MKKTATLHDGRKIDYVHSDNPPKGGMKEVHFSTDGKFALCFYHDQSLKDDNRILRLESIIGNFDPTKTRTDGGASRDQKSADYYYNLFNWVKGIIVAPKFGVLTEKFGANYFFKTGRFKGKDKESTWFTKPKLRKMIPNGEVGHFLGFLMLCRRMAMGLQKMHMTGLAHSDLSNKNVLIDPKNGLCQVLDIDSLVVPGIFSADVVGTPGYIAPEIIRTTNLATNDPKREFPCNWTDLHSLSVLIYEYLLKRHPLRGPKVNSTASAEEDERLSMGERAVFIEHPTDKSNRPGASSRDPSWKRELDPCISALGPHLEKCFLKSFVDGLHKPRSRPTATMWVDALARTLDLLVPCSNQACEGKWFVYLDGKKQKCPWCGKKPFGPFPVVDLHFAPRPGQYRNEGRQIVCHNEKKLHEWHILSNKRMDEYSDTTLLGDIQFHQGHWLLINRDLNSLVSDGGNPVPKGQATKLKEGAEIILSKSEKGRLAVVKFVS